MCSGRTSASSAWKDQEEQATLDSQTVCLIPEPCTSPTLLAHCGHSTTHRASLTVVVQQLLDQVYVCKYHAPAAVPLEAEFGECLALVHAVDEQRKVRVPLVTDYLAAGKAANGNDLGVGGSKLRDLCGVQ